MVNTALPRIVTQIWSALSAVSALIAVAVAFDGYVEGPVLLALAIVVAVAGRNDVVPVGPQPDSAPLVSAYSSAIHRSMRS